jgi:hypothetical protein
MEPGHPPGAAHLTSSGGSMAVPPRDPWHRRSWGYANRPYAGCGCLYLIGMLVVAWLVLSLLFPPYFYNPFFVR